MRIDSNLHDVLEPHTQRKNTKPLDYHSYITFPHPVVAA
jgi:hypothetical protein